jgi:hypothetical protein
VPQTLAPEEIRTVLAAAADVVFSDGVPPEFLDQWAAETCFLLNAQHGTHDDDGPIDLRRGRDRRLSR